MNDPGNDRGAPRQESAAKLVTTTSPSIAPDADNGALFVTNEHGALIAADAAQGWKRYAVETAIRQAAARGLTTFAADDIEKATGITCDGNWVGGIFMRLHREGVIKKAGYRPSTKASRGGSIVTLWTAGDPR